VKNYKRCQGRRNRSWHLCFSRFPFIGVAVLPPQLFVQRNEKGTIMNDGVWSVILHVIAGIILFCLGWCCQFLIRTFWGRRFKKVFGYDVDVKDNYYFVYPYFIPPGRATEFYKPQPKVSRRCCGATNLTQITAGAEARSLSYFGNVFGKNINIVPRIAVDADLDSEMDLSFISMGGLTNFKTGDLLGDDANVFVTFAENLASFVSKRSGQIIIESESVYDYAIIVKIHPKNNPQRTWICCAGLGEWGTSGSAWWLAKNWKTLYKRAKDKPFACITRTKVGSDTSTQQLFPLFFTPEDVEDAIKSRNK